MAFRWNLANSAVALILLIGGTLDTVEGYHVVTSQGYVNWYTARDYCNNTYGSTLATITSDADAAELSSLIQASSGALWWNGLNDLNSEGVWEWQSGHSCGGNCDSVSWWQPGQPNNNGDEDCAFMWASDSSVTMNDHKCELRRLPFICDEAPTTTEPTTALPTTAVPTTAVPTTAVPTTAVPPIGDCRTIESRLDSIESRLDSIESHLSQIVSYPAHSSIGNEDSTFTEAVGENSWSGSTVKVNGKDLVTITSVAVNVALIVSVAVMCFSKGQSSKQYQAVNIASD